MGEYYNWKLGRFEAALKEAVHTALREGVERRDINAALPPSSSRTQSIRPDGNSQQTVAWCCQRGQVAVSVLTKETVAAGVNNYDRRRTT